MVVVAAQATATALEAMMVALEVVVAEAMETQAMAAMAAMAAVLAAAAGRAAPHYEGGRSKQTSGQQHQ